MVILNASEASSTGQSVHQLQQDTLELLIKLLQRLRGKSGQEKSTSALNPEEQQQVGDLCAASVKDLVNQRGVQQITEDGSIAHVYQSDFYTLSADLQDGTGYPVYTVTCAERGDVLKFQDTPGQEGYTFYPTQHELDDAAKADLLSSLKESLESRLQEQEQSRAVLADALEREPGVSATPAMKALDDKVDREALSSKQVSDASAARVRADLESLGEFAPAGSRAALVAHEVLGEHSRQERERDAKYSVQRQEDGTIELFEGRLPRPGEAKEPLVILPPDGKPLCSQAFVDHHRQVFDLMHRKLSQSKQTVRNTAKTKLVSSPAREGR